MPKDVNSPTISISSILNTESAQVDVEFGLFSTFLVYCLGTLGIRSLKQGNKVLQVYFAN